MAYARFAGDDWVITAVNAGETAQRLAVTVPEIGGRRLQTLSLDPGEEGASSVLVDADGSVELALAGRSGVVFRT